jgi:hypothetical protein
VETRPAPAWPTRLPLLLLSLFIGVLTVGGTPPLLVTVPIALLIVMVCAATRTGGSETGLIVPAALVVAAGTVMAPLQLVWLALDAMPAAVPFALLGACAASTILAALKPRWFYPHLALQAAFLVVMLKNIAPLGDVRILIGDSLGALLAGGNPYGLTFPNPYSAEETKRFWAPEFISGDRIDVGFPYLPGALIGDLPGYVLGDVRYASLAAVLLSAALAWRLTSDVVGRALVAALPTSVLSMTTVLGYWVEPLMLLGVALLTWSMANGRKSTGIIGLALLLTVKQYAVVLLPLEKLVRRRLGLRSLLVAVAAAAALVGAFFLVGPSDFWRSVVLLHFSQPFRPDSTTLSVDLVNIGVPIPSWAMATASLAAGLTVAGWVRVTARASATWTALGTGLALAATVLLSKAGHVNYYFVIHGCLVIGLAAWPRELGTSTDGSRHGHSEPLLVKGHKRES